MTNQNETEPAFIPGPYAVVEAFIDGERVDPDALKTALADPAGRDCLVELLALRDAVGGMGPRRWSAMNRRSPVMRRVRWAAAAALVVCAVGAGYVAGQRTLQATPAEPNVSAVVNLGTRPAAPAPTKVITLRPGVDWTENKGER
jgi:hypothetical protein